MNKENKACFIIPFWHGKKDIKCVTEFLTSAKKFNMSKYLIFIVDDKKDGDFLLSLDNEIKIDIVDPVVIANRNNIVSTKKFYGVKKYYKEYSYIGVIDDDVLFVKEFDPFAILEEIWNTKSCFYKTDTIAFKRHLDLYICAVACGLENNLILKKETNNFRSNIWFNDIPVYKSSNVEEFFNWMENTVLLNNKTIFENVKSNVACFDYYIYWYWLIVYKGLCTERSSKLSYFGSLAEEISLIYCNYLQFHNSSKKYPNRVNKHQIFAEESLKKEISDIEQENKMHWTPRDYEASKSLIPNDNIYIQFHTDRLNVGNDYTFYEW